MKKLSTVLLICSSTLLFACSTKPNTTYSSAQPITTNLPTSDASTIVVRRDTGIMGSACPIDIYLNGEKQAKLKSGESIEIHTNAGLHILSAKFTGKGFCQDRLNEIEVAISKQESKYYRLAMGASGDFHIFPTLANPIK